MKMNVKNSMIYRALATVLICVMVVANTGCGDDDDEIVLRAPVLSNASQITATGFTASWAAVTGADKYLLDVSTSSTFATYLNGYNKKEITALTTNVTGLTANTQYYFRVYAKKGSTISAASAVKNVTTAN